MLSAIILIAIYVGFVLLVGIALTFAFEEPYRLLKQFLLTRYAMRMAVRRVQKKIANGHYYASHEELDTDIQFHMIMAYNHE